MVTWTFDSYRTLECDPKTMPLDTLGKTLISNCKHNLEAPLLSSLKTRIKNYPDGITHEAYIQYTKVSSEDELQEVLNAQT